MDSSTPTFHENPPIDLTVRIVLLSNRLTERQTENRWWKQNLAKSGTSHTAAKSERNSCIWKTSVYTHEKYFASL